MIGGRAAWNVVTSLNDSEAVNFGQTEHLEHDLRYDRADEFMEVVLGHWNTWDDDAIKLDRENGIFADPDKVHRLDHKGKFFRSRGPFTVPRSPQGHPVLIQAGQSGRGRTFASRWGELIFVIFANLAVGKKTYADFKQQVAASGRDPDKVKLAPLIYAVPGETKTMAEDKAALIDSLAHPMDALALLSEVLNFDFASKPIDEPFTDDELKSISRPAGHARPGDPAERQGQSDDARLRAVLRSRHDPRGADFRRHAAVDRRSDGGMVQRRRLRRLRAGRHPHAGRLRGFRAPGGAGAAASRLVPQGISRHDLRDTLGLAVPEKSAVG